MPGTVETSYWSNQDVIITINYDCNGRVIGEFYSAHFVPDYPPEPKLLERIYDWLGL